MTEQLDLIDPHGLEEQAGSQVTLTEIAAEPKDLADRTNTVKAFRMYLLG